MRVLNVLAGAENGGAESYFDRLALAFHDAPSIEQQVITRPHSSRVKKLQHTKLKTAPFKNHLDFQTPRALKEIDRNFKPEFSIFWMNRAAGFSKYIQSGINIGRLGGYYDLKYYSHCQQLICATPDLVRYCKENGWSAEKVCYMPNFSDPASDNKILPNVDGKPLKKNGTTIFALGRFHVNKAFDTLLKAMQQLPDVTLWLAGEGSLEEELRKQAPENVVFIPWQRNISALMHHADLFVCPSRHEPFGNVMIEGLSHKKLVVATKTQGAQHIFEDKKTGLLCPIDDADAMAEAIQFGLDNGTLRQEIVANGYEHWLENYSEAGVVRKFIIYFKGLER